MSFLVWIIAGIIAGWLTGMLVRGAGYGLLGDLAIGLIGGLIGGALRRFGIQPTNLIGSILVAPAEAWCLYCRCTDPSGPRDPRICAPPRPSTSGLRRKRASADAHDGTAHTNHPRARSDR
jgi:uncharacterized membrane protein YeaQ/YmgE (transglycosylase-associated protein family)